jgi:small subunit ribosomal protein S5
MSEEEIKTTEGEAPVATPVETPAESTPAEAPQADAKPSEAPATAAVAPARPRPTGARPMASRGARSPRAFGTPASAGTTTAGGTAAGVARAPFRRPFVKRDGDTTGRPPRRGGPGGPRRSTFEDRRPEFEQKILSIRRVVRVVSGGRRLSFAVSMIIGDKKGSIGVGTGKSIDTSNAIQKALKNAKKNLVKLKLTKEHSLPYNVEAKYATSRLTMMPNKGKGIVAGSAARDILKLGGMKNVTAKFHSGSKNKLNNARATVVALSTFAVKKMPGINFAAEPQGVEVKETAVLS